MANRNSFEFTLFTVGDPGKSSLLKNDGVVGPSPETLEAGVPPGWRRWFTS